MVGWNGQGWGTQKSRIFRNSSKTNTLLVGPIERQRLCSLPFIIHTESSWDRKSYDCEVNGNGGLKWLHMLLKPESDQKHVSNMCACTCFAFQMFFSSLLNVLTIIGAVYCMLVSLQALYEGPLICNSQGNSTTSCEFSFEKLRWVTLSLLIVILSCWRSAAFSFEEAIGTDSQGFSTFIPIGTISWTRS